MREHKMYKTDQTRHIVNRITLASIVSVFVILAGVLFAVYTHHLETESLETLHQIHEPDGVEKPKEISLVMVGDNLLHMSLVANAKTADGGYNFDSLYEEMVTYFQDADLSVIVQETVLGGETLGFSGYPLFNSPQEVGDALAKAGFDIVLHATNHALDKGEKGILNSLEYWRKHPDITVLGIHDTQERYNAINYVEKNGIKLALLNYTDSTNGIPVPKSKPYLVNTVDRKKIEADLKTAEENADFTVVFMHWGTEYRLSADSAQKELAEFLVENGADLIMGSHPHVVEPVEWVYAENGNKALVFYSLGNYVSRQKEVANLLGAMAQVNISYNEENGTHIASASVMPTVTHYNGNSRGFRVYPLKDYTDELAKKHGVAQYDGAVNLARLHKIFDSVFQDCTAVTLVK